MTAPMNTQALIAQMREARMTWVDLPEPGKRVRIIRPTDVQLLQQFVKAERISAGFEQAVEFVVDWQGFTAADVVGPALGASDPLAFDRAVWSEVLADRLPWLQAVAQALVTAITTHQEAREADAKNS